jgi:hypothetical protein
VGLVAGAVIAERAVQKKWQNTVAYLNDDIAERKKQVASLLGLLSKGYDIVVGVENPSRVRYVGIGGTGHTLPQSVSDVRLKAPGVNRVIFTFAEALKREELRQAIKDGEAQVARYRLKEYERLVARDGGLDHD